MQTEIKHLFSEEHREHPRVKVNKLVKVNKADKKFETLLVDVSLGGVCLIWPESIQVDDKLTVNFSTDLYFHGIVRWIKNLNDNNYEIGIQFVDLEDIASFYLAEHINNLMNESQDEPDTEEDEGFGSDQDFEDNIVF